MHQLGRKPRAGENETHREVLTQPAEVTGSQILDSLGQVSGVGCHKIARTFEAHAGKWTRWSQTTGAAPNWRDSLPRLRVVAPGIHGRDPSPQGTGQLPFAAVEPLRRHRHAHRSEVRCPPRSTAATRTRLRPAPRGRRRCLQPEVASSLRRIRVAVVRAVSRDSRPGLASACRAGGNAASSALRLAQQCGGNDSPTALMARNRRGETTWSRSPDRSPIWTWLSPPGWACRSRNISAARATTWMPPPRGGCRCTSFFSEATARSRSSTRRSGRPAGR